MYKYIFVAIIFMFLNTACSHKQVSVKSSSCVKIEGVDRSICELIQDLK